MGISPTCVNAARAPRAPQSAVSWSLKLENDQWQCGVGMRMGQPTACFLSSPRSLLLCGLGGLLARVARGVATPPHVKVH